MLPCLEVFFGNLIFAIIARMLRGNHLNALTNKTTTLLKQHLFYQNYYFILNTTEQLLKVKTVAQSENMKIVYHCFTPQS